MMGAYLNTVLKCRLVMIPSWVETFVCVWCENLLFLYTVGDVM